MSKAQFATELKISFYPRLRAAGFAGSGQHFCRVRGEVLQAVNLQGNRHGGSCAVNLGIHLAFLPVVAGDLPDSHGIQEIACEFRRRLAGPGMSDAWWNYGDSTAETTASVASLSEMFFAVADPWFERFSTAVAVADVLNHARISSGTFCPELAYLAPVRAALTGARIHAHLGHGDESRRLATWGLANLGQASALKDALEKLAQA